MRIQPISAILILKNINGYIVREENETKIVPEYEEFESQLDSKLEREFSENEPTVRTFESNQIKTDVSQLRNILQNEMKDLSPEIHNKIESTIRASDVDRNKYRDIFIIKKRVITDGKREIVKFDIKERIIPKPVLYSLRPDSYIGLLFWISIILLLGLLVTTTHKMCQSLIKVDFNK